MGITKIIRIDEKDVVFKASAAIPRIYRLKFQRDIYKDLRDLEKAVSSSSEEESNLDLFSLEMFENIAYIMAKHADPTTVPDSPEEWLDEFSTFSIYQVLPEIIELWGLNVQSDVESKKNFAKAQDRYYRYAGETLEELQETELSGAAFYEYGVKEAPSSALLLSLSDFTLYKWKYGQSVKSYHADVVGTPHPQTITCYVDASHPSIAGFKTITAQYSGVIPLSYTLDDGATYTDTTLQEFLNLDPAALFSSLPESMQMTLIFTLQGDATITSFKITYIN